MALGRNRIADLRAQRRGTGPSTIDQGTQQGGSTSIQHSTTDTRPNSDMAVFYEEIKFVQDTIDTLNTHVLKISQLQSRSLDALDETSAQQNTAELNELVTHTRTMTQELREKIKELEASAAGSSDQMRKTRASFVKAKFLEALQEYKRIEQMHRTKYRERIERQFKIVVPNATQDEVTAVVNDDEGGGNQIFAQALSASPRYEDSRAAYREVQGRHQDIKKMEQTLTELAQMFNDMTVVAEAQQDTMKDIERQAQKIEVDTGAGLRHEEEAVRHAKSARRKRWYMFFVFLILLAILAIVLGVVLGK